MLAAVCSSALACCSVREDRSWLPLGDLGAGRCCLRTRSLGAHWRQHRTGLRAWTPWHAEAGQVRPCPRLPAWVRSPFAIPSAERTAKARGLVISRVIQKPRLAARPTAISTTTKAATCGVVGALGVAGGFVGTGTAVLEHGIKRLEQRAQWLTVIPRSERLQRSRLLWDRWTGPAAWCSRSGSGPGSSGTPPTAVSLRRY